MNPSQAKETDGTIARRITELRAALPEGVQLVAVSKFHPADKLMQAYDAGQRIFAESRANELAQKAAALPDDIEWHFIGHLQTNKVRIVATHADMIQSIDSLRLLRAVNAEAERIGRHIGVLLQVHVAAEESKTGFSPDELTELASTIDLSSFPAIEFRGIMGMATNTDSESRIASDFEAIASTFRKLAQTSFSSQNRFNIVSMGMSHDYPLAIRHGANMIRVGTSIFGNREY